MPMLSKLRFLKPALFLICLTILLFTLSGCGETTVRVENLLVINSSFSGERTITCNLGKDFDSKEEQKQQLEGIVKESCPSVLKYNTVTEDDGYKYIFTLSFSSRDDYKQKIKELLGRQVSVVIGTPNSDLARGWSLKEDFDGMELLSWLQTQLKAKGYKDLTLNFDSVSNVVNYNGDIISSKTPTLEINAVEGYPVNGVTIETTNNKNNSYDRKLILSVPQNTFDAMGDALKTVMTARTDKSAVYSGWTQQGNYQEYQVLYQGINLKELQRVTNLFMDCSNNDIYYGDENQSSTPLAEQLVFEENINTLSFVPQTDKQVNFTYKYSLPIKTTHGQGVLFDKGTWEKQGEWIDGVYTLNTSDYSVYDIRVPDGMQYTIKGIDVELITYDNDSFKRTFDFVYDKQLGEEGLNYAYNFLLNKGVNVTKEKEDKGLVCRITQSGTASEISSQLGNLFGGGNYISCSRQTSAMAVVTDINVVDNINIAYMLTGDNTKVPFTYKASSGGNENISSLTAENQAFKESPKITSDDDGSFTAKLIGGENIIAYNATVPYAEGVATYCIISGIMLAAAFLLIVFFFRKTRRINQKEKEQLLLEQEIQTADNVPKDDYRDNFADGFYDDFDSGEEYNDF